MERCFELARLGEGQVAPNPMVGAVLVHGETIIGEGFHEIYGGPHAEVNCIADAIDRGHTGKIDESTLYVSLEPCAHHGKTPPCTDLIIRHRIPVVIIGCRDPFPEVDGRGIHKLEAAGVRVHPVTGELADIAMKLNKRFFIFHKSARPWIILKWAQTADGYMAGTGAERLLISNEYSNRLVHKWRSEEASILVGYNTAFGDNPELSTRLWPGRSPIRMVIDMNLELPAAHKLFNKEQPTIIFNSIKHDVSKEAIVARSKGVSFYKVVKAEDLLPQLMRALHEMNIQSMIVEGGARLLKSFIDASLWDEARIITNTTLRVNEGLPSPILTNGLLESEENYDGDKISIFKNALMNTDLHLR